MNHVTRAALATSLCALFMAPGCGSTSGGRGGRVLNTELVVVSFGSNNGEVAPCG
jgi:hypothetical protein